MAKMTLLKMTQNILSAMDSDEVNSIFDTVESQQVATVIEETYYEQFGDLDIPELKGILQLTSVSDLDRPNYLKIPNDVRDVEWIKYRDTSGTVDRYKDLIWCSQEEFFNMVLQNTSDSLSPNTTLKLVTDTSGVTYYIKNNKNPVYYTTNDDNFLVFDSYDASEDDTLQHTKTFAWGTKEETFQQTNEYIPPLDAVLFPLLLAEAKSTCFINFKQMSSSKEEQRARRQRIRMQKKKFNVKAERAGKRPNYARTRR